MGEDDAQVTIIVSKLQEFAVYSGDNFRRWVYPRLPKSYAVGPEVYAEARQCVKWGMTGAPAAQYIARKHGGM